MYRDFLIINISSASILTFFIHTLCVINRIKYRNEIAVSSNWGCFFIEYRIVFQMLEYFVLCSISLLDSWEGRNKSGQWEAKAWKLFCFLTFSYFFVKKKVKRIMHYSVFVRNYILKQIIKF